jgi:hemolysin III
LSREHLVVAMTKIVEPVYVSPRWMQSAGEEIANSVSHGIGLMAGLIGAPVLLVTAFQRADPGFFKGTIVFAGTMLFLYLGSTLYHAWPRTHWKYILRVVDHSAIFLLIAGTYTPFALGPLWHRGGLTILGVIWATAVFGIIVKMVGGPSRHPRLMMCLYLGMGWLIPIVNRPLLFALPSSVFVWLLAGGLAYTLGVLFFINEHVRYSHFIWHLFVLTGTACHFTAVFVCAGWVQAGFPAVV